MLSCKNIVVLAAYFVEAKRRHRIQMTVGLAVGRSLLELDDCREVVYQSLNSISQIVDSSSTHRLLLPVS
jgi:hypothetical protein